MRDEATFRVKTGLAEMLKGGVIMDVVDAEQAKIAEDAGAAAVMALERVPSDIRRDGGVARMSDPAMIKGIQAAVTIPVMAKARIGHFVEAQVLEALEVDYIDESEVLTPADEAHHIDKWAFKVPFVCGATNLGEALRRIGEGAAMIRSKGEAGTGDIVEAVRHMRSITGEIRRLATLDEAELFVAAKELQAPLDVVRAVAQEGKLPVPLFSAGGIATPADAALMMQLGAESVFVGSGIFKSEDPDDARPRDRRGDDALPGPRADRPRVRGPGHRDGLARVAQARRASSCSPPAAGSAVAAHRRPRPPGRASPRTRGSCARSAPTCARCGPLADLEGLDGLVMPGGESTTMTLGIEREGARRAAARARRVGHAGLRHVRRADHARPRPPRGARHARASATPSAASSARSRPTSTSQGLDGDPVHAIFIRAPWIAERGRRRRGAGRRSTATRSRCGRATCSPSRSTRSWARTRACTSGSWPR